MSDFQQYRDRVANYGKLAAQADNAGRFQEAIDYYLKAVELFQHMIKCKSIKSQSLKSLTYAMSHEN
jgi:hypothetical protein